MPARHDQGVSLRVDVERGKHVLDRPDHETLGGREPLATGVLMAIVNDPHVKVGSGSQVGHSLPDMPRPHHD